MHFRCLVLQVDCNLAMHHAAFGLQQAIEHVQAIALGATAHDLVQVHELTNTSESTNSVAERPFAYFVLMVG
jgi:hypothetical protein